MYVGATAGRENKQERDVVNLMSVINKIFDEISLSLNELEAKSEIFMGPQSPCCADKEASEEKEKSEIETFLKRVAYKLLMTKERINTTTSRMS
jgi:hypothetical protein